MKKFSNKDYVPAHCHSAYSRFDGLCPLDSFVMAARKMEFPAIAITDHGSVMSWINFLNLARSTKNKKDEPIPYPPIKAILGAEFYLSRQMDVGQYEDKKKNTKAKNFQPDFRRGNRHLNLYARNWFGYQNLCHLSQKSWLEGFYFDPRIDIELLSKHSKGLMCGSACLGSVVNINLLHGNYNKAKEICTLFKDIFDDNFFLEVMYHGIPEEKAIIPDIFKLSSELDIPVIATNDTHYIKKEEGASQEVLMAMASSKCIYDPKRIHFPYHEFYLKSAQEMAKIFGHKPQCLYNSVAMAERVDTQDIENNLFGGMRLPKFDIPKGNKDSFEYMEKLAWEGLKKVKWNKSEPHIAALKKELEDVRIAKLNNNYDFAKYFLIVADYINKAKELGAMVGPGRGSGYASVLLRCLGITYGVDPLEYSLIWERFLGFSKIHFMKESDFGFAGKIKLEDKNDLGINRELKDDQGG